MHEYRVKGKWAVGKSRWEYDLTVDAETREHAMHKGREQMRAAHGEGRASRQSAQLTVSPMSFKPKPPVASRNFR